jgi:hypothetical protein
MRRLLTSWVDWYVSGNWDDGQFYSFAIAPQADYPSTEQEKPVHVPDISTADGLLDLISVGCLVELSQALDERTYTYGTIAEDEQDEIDAATTRYRLFMRWYAKRFVIIMNNEWINAHYIFKRRLVDFGATMVRYAREQLTDTHAAPDLPRHQLTASKMSKLIELHLSSGWPDLVHAFLTAKTNASPRLYYTGPKIELKRLTRHLRLKLKALNYQETHDFSLAPLDTNQMQLAIATALSGSQSSDDDDDDGEEAEDGDGEDEDEGEDEEDDGGDGASSPLSDISPSDSSMRPPPQPSTPPRRKRGHPSPASTPSKTPSSSRPNKRVK